ncbi:DNA-binding transcriptional regulator, AcrR family [Streptomyces sp. 3213]|uniref:TetR/AcrR family transcriptional regulator n=1 Tax=Streptomyces sp. 3213.3 TaxID=1855348 RepID=UPI000895AFFC|nr:TetR/AcrR family transcriptional regulator [Streptomyces sp. 3213.3]SEF03915.1 DNA-binding transcriptional regulator, AcrR family [Streptomyces sp. 3213] [Streptomyces sp. 3213.3]
MSKQASAPGRRKRLTQEREREILDVTFDLVAEVGYEQATVDEVARRTKASTATLYRQWENKPRLVITAMMARKYPPLPPIDAGSLRDDLVTLARMLPPPPPSSAPNLGIWQAVLSEPALAQALRDVLFAPYLDALRGILARHVERGTIRPDNPALAHAEMFLMGSVFVEKLFAGTEADADQLIAVMDALLLPALTSRE